MNDRGEYLPDGMLTLKKSVSLPDVLDLLVVGGGPAGTAAAFHAKELGLSVLVIDYDDLMKRIRDYPKDKLILPDFGGGDQMRFPRGGDLVSLLHFTPIDKDEMCAAWKGFYRDFNIPAQVGIELLGLERQQDGGYRVKTWNHNTKSELVYRAKHVVIAIGRGVPRRFDIPGNTDGVAYRLADANAYVGEPVLVIGGGTSAAEAVIAISGAKAKSNDPSAVYWSYRGEKLPKVSKALADVFFEAYVGNGNIRYFPNSEPVAVVTADDQKDYLSLRVDRKCIAGRPNETAHLEFSKRFCIACIGEDIPEAFLNSMGIVMASANTRKRMVVTQILETQQPNVFLIGDILSQAYFETDSFDANPETFREIKHRGNIKTAVRDGVLVAKVVAQKLAGKKEFDIEITYQEEEKKAKTTPEAIAIATILGQSPIAPPTTPEPEAKVAENKAFLVRLLPGGVEENEYPLNENGVTTIGRKFCDIVFPDDEFLGERHASISQNGDGFSLRDDGGATGVFLRLPEGKAVEITDGDLIRLGRQFLVLNRKGDDVSLSHYDQRGTRVDWYPLSDQTVLLGREAPDVTLDSNDMTLSRRHISVALKDDKVVIKDLKSVNGTYLKLRQTVMIGAGDQFRMGHQSFRLSLQEVKAPEKLRVSTRITVPPVRKASPAPAEKEGAAKGMTVIFKNAGKTVNYVKGQTICEIAEKNGLKIVAECHAGICGSDPIRILSGQGNVNPPGAEEKGTLEDICGLKPGECRLACMVRPGGPLEVEIIG